MTERGRAWSKQRPETLAAVCDALRIGVPTARAAKLAGISESTFQNWRRTGWEAIEAADEDSSAPVTFVAQFAIAVEAAVVEFMTPFLSSPLKKALLTGFHSTAKHNATKAVSPSSETMRTI